MVLRRHYAMLLVTACTACAGLTNSGTAPKTRSPASVNEDLAAARALFARNLAAINNKDRDAYLACYLDGDTLVRAGLDGVKLGFKDLATATSTVPGEWPVSLEASDLTVHPVVPGVVYGNYKYRVTFADKTTSGWSERVFIKTQDGWRIAVTTAFEAPSEEQE